ncbi:MAG: hypothetical protein J6L73_06440 [Muribaculaceae bacterium]|nr:hypothetical protein [Muribaculaceae bacterium]
MISDMKHIMNTDGSPLIIAGPCSAESRTQVLTTAGALHRAGVRIFRAGVWKPRTRPGGFEGYGELALPWLAEVKERFGMLTATEVGTPRHAELALRAGIDVVWIGARTTACPFVTQEIAEALRGTDIPVFVKNPASADLDLWIGAVERFARCGLSRLGAILRGFKTFIRPDDTCPPYRNTPFWEVADRFRAELPELPMLCDPSHIGGARCHIAPLSREALSRGYDGLIIETHCNPAEAMTDAAQQLTPEALARLMESIAVPV